MMCRVLCVSRSGYYSWLSQARPSSRELRDAELLESIREIHKASRGTYGSPRVHAELVRRGIKVSKERVARLMRVAGIQGCVLPRFKVTTDSQHDEPIAPNRLNQEFETESSDSVWCADITYIRTLAGFVYMAAIIDLKTRLIVGWTMARHMRTKLVEEALLMALGWRAPASRLVHHSDRGSQYASESYQDLLERHGMECSMSRKGNCYDNAVIESFFGTFKQELAHRERWTGLGDARAASHEYIEVFYNRQRLHSALGYSTPAEADEEAA